MVASSVPARSRIDTPLVFGGGAPDEQLERRRAGHLDHPVDAQLAEGLRVARTVLL